MIRFSMGDKTLDPRNLKDAVMASVLESVRNKIREEVGNIRDPDTGEFPTIVIRGNSLDDLKIQVEGSPALVALVNARLGLEAAGEPSAAPESQPHVFISYTSED